MCELKAKPGTGLPLLLFASILLTAFIPRAEAMIGTYYLALIHVTYSDTTPLYAPAQMSQVGREMTAYFAQLSYGRFKLVVAPVEVNLPHPKTYYTACTHACPNLFADAAEAVAETGFSFQNINGISVVSTYCARNFTHVAAHIVTAKVNGTFNRSLDYECRGQPNGPSGVHWGAWAHELGHQIEYTNWGSLAFSFGKGGHPSGYSSGYELMDSCYPCQSSAYSLLNPPIVTGTEKVFGDWMNTKNVAVVSAPTPGTTVVLTPIEQPFVTTQANQAIQVPLAPGVYYVVEARKRLLADTLLNNGVPPLGIYDEGVLISEIEQMRDPPVHPVDACDTLVPGGCIHDKKTDPRFTTCNQTTRPAYCWPYDLWHVGDTFTDPNYGVTIKVDSTVGDGYAVTVARTPAPGHPNTFIVPWLTPPMNTYETEDIWVDSSCNGYESDVGPSGLLYGRRADGTVIGNGDDPCANHENRIYATIHNLGDQQANNIKVTFRVSNPLGVGMTDSWTSVGEATIPSLAPGASISIYTNWTPRVTLTAARIASTTFAFHSCIQVIIEPVGGEIITSDNQAQENFDNFAAVRTRRGSFEPIHRTFFIRRPDVDGPAQTYYLNVTSHLPRGWRYEVAGGRTELTLAHPGEKMQVPVDIFVPADAKVGESYNLDVQALTEVTMTNAAIPDNVDVSPTHTGLGQAGGVVLSARAVLPSRLSLLVRTDRTGEIDVSGRLSPHLKTWIAIDFTDAAGTSYTRLARTDGTGNFVCRLPPWRRNASWQVHGVWQGNQTHSGAISPERSVRTRDLPDQPDDQQRANCA